MGRKRIVQAGKCYHLVSRVAHKAFFFDDEEQDRFVDLLMRVEFFCCVKVLAYCCISKHIHVFIFLEEGREMSEDEILARVNALYRRSEIVKLHRAAIRASRGTSRRHCRRSPSRRCSATGFCTRDARFWREQKFGIYSKAYTEGSVWPHWIPMEGKWCLSFSTGGTPVVPVGYEFQSSTGKMPVVPVAPRGGREVFNGGEPEIMV